MIKLRVAVDRDVAIVLRRTEAALEVAQSGLDDLNGEDDSRQLAGFHVVVVFGRSVTNVLQGLRSAVGPAFDEWYEPWQSEMRRDKLLRFFYKMRSTILKEGDLGVDYTARSARISKEGQLALSKLFDNRPEGAPLWLGAKQLVWTLPPDAQGNVAEVTVPTPEGVEVDETIRFCRPPRRHLGRKLHDDSLAGLAQLYVTYLSALVAAAKAQFGDEPQLF